MVEHVTHAETLSLDRAVVRRPGPGNADGRVGDRACRLARGVEAEEPEAVGDGPRRRWPSPAPLDDRTTAPREELLDGGACRVLGALGESRREGVSGGGGDGSLLARVAGGGGSERGREGEEGPCRAGGEGAGGLGDARPVLPREGDCGGGGAGRRCPLVNANGSALPWQRPTVPRRSGV